MKRLLDSIGSSLAVVLLAAAAHAQANTDPRIDGYLHNVFQPQALARNGSFPNGVNGIAVSTTVCNLGTAEIEWHAAMEADHPLICTLIVREHEGRFEQISDRSHVKHVFFAASNSSCASCQGTDGSSLGLGCSDTYDASTNGSRFWLGPPDEVDPWLGTWDPICSLFDRGLPPVAPPLDCDGQRSLTSSQADMIPSVEHRVVVRDADLDVPGTFWQQVFFLVAREGEARRDDNLASNELTPSWSGSRWDLSGSGPLLHGSVLQRWNGASVDSATNGADDGRLYVAVKVTGPVGGLYHYEYAVHNRDNHRGVGSFRVPKCADALVLNLGFGDVDDVGANDWSAAVGPSDVTFATTSNPLRWNSIFNFRFDSDAAPRPAPASLGAFDPGPGLPSVSVGTQAPLRLPNVLVGPGCASDPPPRLYTAGSPPEATIGNASFALVSSRNDPSQPSALFYSFVRSSFVLSPSGCRIYLGASPLDARLAHTTLTDASGVAVHPTPIPNDVSLEGRLVRVQCFSRDPGNGRIFGSWEASNALELRVGSAISDCP